jgi:hypothetical protein
VIAPDGTLTADKIVENTESGEHRVFDLVAVTPQFYVQTYYLKEAGVSRVAFLNGTSAGTGFIFNLTTGLFEAGSGFATNVGNGWWRVSIERSNADTNTRSFGINLVRGATTLNYTGDGFSGIYIWGAQIEAGAFPTSYIPTVASQVTRAADNASMIGNNFARWYNVNAGTVFVDVIPSAPTASPTSQIAWDINNGTAGNRFRVFRRADTGGSVMSLTSNGASQFDNVSAGVIQPNAQWKNAAAYKVNDFALAANSNLALRTSGVLPTVDRLSIGLSALNTLYLNGTISRIAYFNRRLANTELTALTS